MTSGKAGRYQNEGLNRPGLKSESVRKALSMVPRHCFVPENLSEYAYQDSALPIGNDQTISQPYIVALMIQEANIAQGDKVLEIGTGSGYQAAVLAELGARVYSIEIIPALVKTAQTVLSDLGYSQIVLRQGDGSAGWIEEAPFKAILVSAVSPGYPPRLLAQLEDRGRLIIPIKEKGKTSEELMQVERIGTRFETRRLGGVKFVPLRGDLDSPAQKPIYDLSSFSVPLE